MNKRYIAIILSVLFIDQATKRIAEKAGLQLHLNSGVSMGFFKGHGLFLTALIGLMLLFLFAVIFCKKSPLKNNQRAFTSVMAGGAAGNYIDRVICGSVVDWITLPFSANFFSGGLKFNCADIAVYGGAFMVLLLIFKNIREH